MFGQAASTIIKNTFGMRLIDAPIRIDERVAISETENNSFSSQSVSVS